MSITWGAQYPKLKTNLRLAINRMKMMGKKKTELGMKARTEIADYIQANKSDRARIRVEHIIREDYLVEAYELLEMYCDLLLARFGLIEQMTALDDGIAEAVISILWAAPRITTDIPEFKVISDQLTHKYKKPFAEAARANQLEAPAKVSPKLIQKLEIAAPPKPLVERYMIEIASAAGIPFTPDPNVMREDEVSQAEKMLIKFHEQGNGGPITQPPPPNTVQEGYYGWNLPHGGGHPPPGGAPPPPPYGGGNGGNIYEVPSAGPKYDVPPGDDFNWTPQPNASPGVIQLPQIGPNGLPINPPSGPPHAPPPAAAYPMLSQRGSMVTPSSGPSAPPQTVRKPDGPPPNDFGEISQHPPFGVVKWREGEGYPPMNDIPNQTPDEHIYDEIPTTGEYMGIWELQSKSKDATMSSIDIDPAVPGYRQISNSQPLHLREAKDQSEDDLRKSEPLDLNRFPGLPAPKEGEIYVMGANGVPILVRQDAFDATTPIHYSNGGFPQCENTNCPYAPKGRYPYIDSSQKTLETFRSGGEIIEEPELNLNFPEVPSGGLGRNNKPGNGGGGGAGGGGNDLDFDELARRFDQLKKK